jgi:pyruvate formate lyase activating enzyme
LISRIGKIDAIVFSGGEPLLQDDLAEFIEVVKNYGFLIGIHTSGIAPSMFEKIITMVNWVGFDIKTAFQSYGKVTQVPNSGALAERSLEILLNSGVDYEIRTTYDTRIISQDDIFSVARTLKNLCVQKWIIQRCVIREFNKMLPLINYKLVKELRKFIDVQLRL